MMRAIVFLLCLLGAGAAQASCASVPSPLWCDTFEAYTGGNNSTVTAPKLFQPYQDAQALGAGTINNGTFCNSGANLALSGAHLGDEVVGTPGSVTSCGGIPLGQGFDFGFITAAGGGPNGTMSQVAGFGGVDSVNLTAFRAEAQSTCSIAGTTLTAGGTFAPGMIIRDNGGAGGVIAGTAYILSGSAGTYTINKSQTANPTTPCTGAYWGILNGQNARVFNNSLIDGTNTAGIGTTGTGASFGRMFTQNLSEGYVSESVYFSSGSKTDWNLVGPFVASIDNSGGISFGISIHFYSNSGPANSMDVLYGTASACTMTGSPFVFTPNVVHTMVMAWKSSAASDGYVQLWWDGSLVASASGANQGAPCNMPTTLNITGLNGEGSAASPLAEFYADDIGVFNVPFNPNQGTSSAMTRLVE